MTASQQTDVHSDARSAASEGQAPSTRVLMSPRPEDYDERPISPPARPAFLHPTISRLRSFVPSPGRLAASPLGTPGRYGSPERSHFSSISRASSTTSHLQTILEKVTMKEEANEIKPFRWTALREITRAVYAPTKAASVLGAGAPTVLAANGLVCIGTSNGKTLVFDFKQTLRCVCGSDTLGVPI